MIGIVDIIRAYSGLLETTLGDPPVTKDLIEVRDRPCTYLQPGDCVRTREGSLVHDDIGLEVYYFGQYGDRGYIDLLNMRETLSDALLEPVEVDDGFYVLAESVSAELIRDEMILVLRFSVETMQEPDDDSSGALMQTLDMDIDINEEED